MQINNKVLVRPYPLTRIMLYFAIFFVVFVISTDGAKVTADLEQNRHLSEALRKASGVYIDPKRQTTELKKTVVLTSTNDGFMDFTLNLHCYMKHLGLSMLVLALDQASHHKLKKYNIPSYLVHGNTGFNISSEESSWEESNYMNILIR